ncbi:MAG: 30S ribosome-binding factor RbfA [Clostridia bacterium]|nr:30S ribosome-binding factor RbfA [Clostridia bacterium]
MGFDRTDRISEEVKRECANILRELKDPRIPEFISITRVDVTRDLKYAKVYVSIFQKDWDVDAAVKGLNSSAGYVRREIAKRVKLRYTPEFSFTLDEGIKIGAHINDIISEISSKDRGNKNDL